MTRYLAVVGMIILMVEMAMMVSGDIPGIIPCMAELVMTYSMGII